MIPKEARKQIYDWATEHGVYFDDSSREELKKLIIQYGETVSSQPTKVDFIKKTDEFHAPKSFG